VDTDRLVEDHKKLVYHVIHRTVRDRAAHEEIFQEVFLNVFESLPRFEARSKLSTWIASIAVHTCYKFIHEAGKRERVESFGDWLEGRPDPGVPSDLQENLERNGVRRRLERHLGELAPKYALPVTLFYLKGMSYREIAAINAEVAVRPNAPANPETAPNRTLWYAQYDLDDLTLTVKFYLGEKPELGNEKMNEKLIFLSSLLLVAVILASAQQSDFPKLTGPYLGQKPPGMTPKIFAPGIISTKETQEFAGTFSPDGKEFFFTRRPTYNDFQQQRIWYTKEENGKWTEPALAPFTYSCFEAEPHITPDGMRLFYGSSRPLPGNTALNQIPAIWLLNKTAAGWGNPEYFGPRMMYMGEANNRSLYYTALYGAGYIAVRRWNGANYEAPERLSDSVNCLESTAHSFIAPDESYILYDGSMDGSTNPDIYVSFKKNDGSWTRGVKLGHNVNTNADEICSSVSPDGQYLFFESDRAGTMDIYWVSAKIIEELRPKQ